MDEQQELLHARQTRVFNADDHELELIRQELEAEKPELLRFAIFLFQHLKNEMPIQVSEEFFNGTSYLHSEKIARVEKVMSSGKDVFLDTFIDDEKFILAPNQDHDQINRIIDILFSWDLYVTRTCNIGGCRYHLVEK